MPQRDKLCLTITNILSTCSIAVRGGVLYTGITNALTTRVMEHRRAEDRKSFTAQYRAFRLVYYEEFGDVRAAIAREKQIKG
jgi:putative endonuclease